MSHFFQILFLITAVVVNIIGIKRFSYDNENNLTCDNYILNTYLYLLSAFLIISLLLVVTNENKKIEKIMLNLFSNIIFIVAYLVLFVIVIISINKVSPKDQPILLHILWLIAIGMLTDLLYFPVKSANLLGILKPVIVITLLVVFSIAYLGIYHGKQIVTFDWDKYLRYGLIVLIISYFVIPFLIPNNQLSQIHYVLSFVSLIIFILLLLSYNKDLTERAKLCYKENNPNYPKEALGLATKIVNIFGDITRLLINKKMLKRLRNK